MLASKSSLVLEYLAFIAFNATCLIGNVDGNGWMNFDFLIIWTGIVRQLCGLSLSYLITLMLSPKAEESIAWYRPTRYMRAVLSWNFWVPFAVLSYSLYVCHVYMIILV